MAEAQGGEQVQSRGGAYDKGEGIVSASRDHGVPVTWLPRRRRASEGILASGPMLDRG